ncbi:hypothetical protein LNQ49_05080 [Flavobacterium sp. F-65]|uniref:ApeA N-terminal domain-containing protein n=1 Tax=Flavobacterium pisciphilum TaxID=2893755 RepID=A0ABS8MQD8_9FLAO|nr:hypothetical protein [Flavobacterium sp. F-65]MCC9070971.1 hypothetical protein [Flavobacterium sp. F-65]
MKEYFQRDIQISLHLAGHQALLGEIIEGDIQNVQYDARLVYNERKPEHLQLLIYYKPADFLYEKLNFLYTSKVNILEVIQPVISQHAWVHPDILDFSGSSLIEMKDTHYWDHDKKTLMLVIDNLELILNGRYAGDARFKMNENIFLHLDQYVQYGMLGNYESNDKFIERNDNKMTKFGPVDFILNFNHSYKSSPSVKDFQITRDAYLTLTDHSETLKDTELLKLGEDLCLLMSLYWEKNIDFFSAVLRINNLDNYKTREVFRFTSENPDYNEAFFLKDMYPTFYEFAQSVNFEKYQIYKALVRQAVPRLIRIKNLDDISVFMILYNIIEKFRNYFLENPFGENPFIIKEEFEFTKGVKRTNEFIKNKIKEIGEIIKESDQAEFDSKANLKVSFIKKTGLIDQFENFILYLDLDPGKYEVELTDLIRIRNIIYHGSIPQEDITVYNKEMKVMIFDILLRIISE